MKVFAVGTGCNWFTRNNTSFILDDKILFDTPNGSYKQIIKNVDLFSLEGIIITHFHSDHFADMHVIATRFMRESDRIGRKEKIKIYGPKGMLDELIEINRIFYSAPDELNKDNFLKHIDFVEVKAGDEFELCGYKVKVYEMNHFDIYALGYTFTDKNSVTVAFSGDTKDCESLQNMLAVSKVAFVDMAAPTPAKAHLDTEGFVKLQEQFSNCKMYPVHTSDMSLKFAKDNNLNIVNDGDTIII